VKFPYSPRKGIEKAGRGRARADKRRVRLASSDLRTGGRVKMGLTEERAVQGT